MDASSSSNPPIQLRPLYHDRLENMSSESSAVSEMRCSEPLLGDEMALETPGDQWQNPFSKRRRRLRLGSLSKGIGDAMPHGRRMTSRTCTLSGLSILVILGIVQLVTLLSRFVVLILPSRIDNIISQWGQPGHMGFGLVHYPTDFSRDILPIPCHSHNDYWRDVPLFNAVRAGCIGVEADIWLFAEELYVGHSIASLTPNRTLNSLYINPLLSILDRQNPDPQVIPEPEHQRPHGVFDTEPEQPLIFLIDFKTQGDALWPYMYTALDPFRQRNYLTKVVNDTIIEGPITVVGTGNTPFNAVISDELNPHKDVFFDAPLEKMYLAPDVPPPSSSSEYKYNPLNSFYASVALPKALDGNPNKDGEFSPGQIDLLRGQLRGAHARGLKARYWDTPFWPIGMRNRIWDILVREGVDLLNVDDLEGAAKRDWGENVGWWRRSRVRD